MTRGRCALRADNGGRDVGIENHENRFADMERGREADGMSERGRDVRGGGMEMGKQAKRPMFSVIS